VVNISMVGRSHL